MSLKASLTLQIEAWDTIQTCCNTSVWILEGSYYKAVDVGKEGAYYVRVTDLKHPDPPKYNQTLTLDVDNPSEWVYVTS